MTPVYSTAEPLGILVVDDSASCREVLRNILQKIASVTVIGEVGDGNSAIEMAFRLVPQVILMDVDMPRLGGIEATRRIKRVLPNVHVIGVSSSDDTLTRAAMKAAGCSAFVP